MEEYSLRTALIRNGEQSLLLSYVKPHKAVTRDTVSRWIKMVINISVINTDIFVSHSVRSYQKQNWQLYLWMEYEEKLDGLIQEHFQNFIRQISS